MNIEHLYRRLIEIVRDRVAAGAFTEAGLARLSGLSQPQLHHVLKGKRAFSARSAGQVMDALGIGVAELLWSTPDAEFRMVPVLSGRIGPGADAAFSRTQGLEPYPSSQVDGLINPLAARVAFDPLLPPVLRANDLILLDRNPFLCDRPRGGCWVIAESAGLRIRHVRLDAGKLLIGGDPGAREPRRWRAVPLAGRGVRDVVRAHVAWMGRKMAAEPAGPVGPARRGQ